MNKERGIQQCRGCCFVAYRMKSKLALSFYSFCAVIFLVTVFAFPVSNVRAQSIVTGLPFSGRVIGPAIYPFLAPACPYHILVKKPNPAPGASPILQSPLMGIIPLPGSLIFREFNLITPGVWLLGTYSPTVILPPICPYPVAPLIQVGTGLVPGL